MEAPQEGEGHGARAPPSTEPEMTLFPLLQLTCQQILQAGAERRF